jgi:hypothetical protein
VLFSPFCEVAQVLIISIFNQIWQYSEYESRKSLAPFHIVGGCDDFW